MQRIRFRRLLTTSEHALEEAPRAAVLLDTELRHRRTWRCACGGWSALQDDPLQAARQHREHVVAVGRALCGTLP